MGASVSKDALEHTGLLDALCGPSAIEPRKLEQLFHFSAPLSSLPPLEVENAVAELCGRLREWRSRHLPQRGMLPNHAGCCCQGSQAAPAPHCPPAPPAAVVHNPITHNFQQMLLHYLEVLSQAQSGAPKAVDAAANGTYLIASMIKCVAESAPSSCLQSLFDVAPNLPQLVQGEAPAGRAALPACSARAAQGPCRADAPPPLPPCRTCMHERRCRAARRCGWSARGCSGAAAGDPALAAPCPPCAGLHTLLPLFVNRCLLFLCNCHPR
jgi:hypothetical protein